MIRVKICGITNLQDAQVAIKAGADFLGFIFYPQSPRHVKPEHVREIVTRIRAQYPLPNIQLVGVFVDQSAQSVAWTLDFCDLDYAQLHGTETPEAVTTLMGRGFGVIKALRVRDGRTLVELERYKATAYLLDAYVPGQPGGTGHGFDWTLAVQAKTHGPIVLAGGLTPDNVAQAVRTVCPWAVDVSSGVEAAPGRKDPDKVHRFIAEAKSVYTVLTRGKNDDSSEPLR
jgi:phosphoribosylanthranilate isomerase